MADFSAESTMANGACRVNFDETLIHHTDPGAAVCLATYQPRGGKPEGAEYIKISIGRHIQVKHKIQTFPLRVHTLFGQDCSTADAQSSVTLYGIVDADVE
ncbi:hypothetical protein [Paraburkholderia fungorum]|uniref:hypothetical protein n=1 Tax=Paraburkholderia fungorum TaxID=134537 RepID=UPI001C1EEC3F|nr:hypothetical protein [Paraburkholderia fungorum]MBU7442640.1 hypothetical protein [Paraburkholderia fungorum]